MDTYEGSIYDPDTLHKYLYANGNPVKYTDPSGNFSIVAQAAANAINHVLTTAYNVNLMGLVSGIGKMAVSAIMGADGMDLVSDFFGGYMSGVFTMGLGAIVCVTVAHRLASVTKLLSAFAHASTTLTTVMLVYSVITKNDKDTLFYATALLMNVAYACMTIYSSGKIRVSGDKGSGFIEFDNSDPDHMLINGSKLKRGGGFGGKGGLATVNSKDVHFMQSSIKNQTGQHTVLGNATALKEGTLKPSDLPEIKIWSDEKGKLWTLDHRRLAAFRLAELDSVPFKWATDEEVANQMWKMTTKTEGMSIKLKLGNGESIIIE